jgi:hypothetical protein
MKSGIKSSPNFTTNLKKTNSSPHTPEAPVRAHRDRGFAFGHNHHEPVILNALRNWTDLNSKLTNGRQRCKSGKICATARTSGV